LIENVLSQQELRELPYYNDALIIRQILSALNHQFPKWACQDISYCNQRLLNLQTIAGAFCPTDEWHAWNYDPERKLYFDSTFDQFDLTSDQLTAMHVQNKYLLEFSRRTKMQTAFKSDYFCEVQTRFHLAKKA